MSIVNLKAINVAVVGATGAVGECMLKILAERNFPVATLYALASKKSAGKRISYQGKDIVVSDLSEFDFSQTPIALFSAGSKISEEYAPKAVAAGAVVIDNTSQFRYDDDVPLVVPEVNPEAIADYSKRGIIANPNCSTIQMLLVLKPLHDKYGITRVNVATYQSVSGTGKEAIDELVTQTGDILAGKTITPKVYPKQIAFNVLPQIDCFMPNGYTKEEMKMIWETQKILSDKQIKVNPTTARVPVIYGHSEAIHLELKKAAPVEEVQALLSVMPGVRVIDAVKDGAYPTAATEAAGSDEVFVGRIRKDISCDNGINLWVVSDNLRKGAATNSVQIAEIVLRDHLYSNKA